MEVQSGNGVHKQRENQGEGLWLGDNREASSGFRSGSYLPWP
jgi:hypothetical protein